MVVASPNLLRAGVDDFRRIAASGEAAITNLSTASNAPSDTRTMRLFNTTEILGITNATNYQWNEFLKKHPEALEHSSPKLHRIELKWIHQFLDETGNRPSKPAGQTPITFFVGSLKGGSAKTCTTLNLAVPLAIKGYRVLVIDADMQHTLTSLLGLDAGIIPLEDTIGAVYEAMHEQLEEMPQPLRPFTTHIDGLHIIPASLEMAEVDFMVNAAFSGSSSLPPEMDTYIIERLQQISSCSPDKADAQAEQFQQILSEAKAAFTRPQPSNFYGRVKHELDRIAHDYDIILIDTSPSFSIAQINLLWAADGIIMPIAASLPDLAACFSFNRMLADNMEALEQVAGSRIWQPVMAVHTKTNQQSASNIEISYLSNQVMGQYRMEEFIPTSSAIDSSMTLLRSIYEIGPQHADRRAVRRALEFCDALASRVELAIKTTWADRAARAASSEDHA